MQTIYTANGCRTGTQKEMDGKYCPSPFLRSGGYSNPVSSVADGTDRNRHKALRTAKKALELPERWKIKGFHRFGKAVLTKKETSFRMSLLVREAGLEPARA